MGDGQVRNAVLHGILRPFVVVEQPEQRFIGAVAPAAVAADVEDQVFTPRGQISPHGSPHPSGLFFIQVARRETDQIRFAVHPTMGELRVITLHPCRVIRRSAD